MRLPLLSSKNIKKARLPYQSGFLFIMRQENGAAGRRSVWG